jgi:hypothetical protein
VSLHFTESCHNTGIFLAGYGMNDDQKTKEQLPQELARQRERSSALSGLEKARFLNEAETQGERSDPLYQARPKLAATSRT